jgi:hypothetical protein
MKALSLWQPWATLVASGAKRIETRCWSTNYRGRLAIHASKKWSKELGRMCLTEPFKDPMLAAGFCAITRRRSNLPFGQIIATCYLADVFSVDAGEQYYRIGGDALARVTLPPPEPERSFGDYTPGRFAWILTEIVPLKKPFFFQGSQKLFTVSDELFTGGAA